MPVRSCNLSARVEIIVTTLSGRGRTALLIVDAQTGVTAGAHGRDAVVANIALLVEKARDAHLPLIWVRHNSKEFVAGSQAWAIVDELEPHDGEAIIEKRYGDAFEDTDLEAVLARSSVGRLVVAGAQSDACIRSTIHGAFARGYDVTLIGDAHTTEDLSQWGAPPPDQVIAHTNLYWSYQTAPGREARVVKAAEVDYSSP
jgi:nicotinamidase-related amidase